MPAFTASTNSSMSCLVTVSGGIVLPVLSRPGAPLVDLHSGDVLVGNPLHDLTNSLAYGGILVSFVVLIEDSRQS